MSTPTREIIRQQLTDSFPFEKPRQEQIEAFDSMTPWIERLFINQFQPSHFGCDAPTGCHAKGTPILMFNGTIKLVEEVQVGDLLMGPDSTPRRVLSLYRGRETLVQVLPTKGESFTVNESHILSLKKTVTCSNHRTSARSKQGRKRRKDFQGLKNIFNLSVRDYQEKSKTFKHCHKLYRVGVDFPEQSPLPFDPYLLGIWLGDGNTSAPCITNPDPEVQKAWLDLAEKFKLEVRRVEKPGCSEIHLVRRVGTEKENPVSALLRSLQIFDLKNIPQKYLTSSKADRLELLAGLLDTDGHLGPSGTFDFINVQRSISEGVAFLARSVGLAAYISPCEKGCQTGAIGTYYRVQISGDCKIIPTRVERKKARSRGQIKDPLVTGFSLGMLPEGDYFGFELDQDHLYLLGDFTVTHNTGKSLISVTVAQTVIELINEYHTELGIEVPHSINGDEYPFQVWVVTQNKLLQDQYNKDFKDRLFDLRGLDNYKCYFEDTTCGQSKCARLRAPDSAKGWKPPQYCSRACEYDEARKKSRMAPILLLNVAKALTLLKDPSQPRPLMMIFDEGHGVEAALDNQASVVIDGDLLNKLDYRFERYFQEFDVDAIEVGMQKLMRTVGADMELEYSLPPDVRDSKKYKRLESLAMKVGGVLESIEQGIQFVSCSEEKVDLRPLKVHMLFERTFQFPTLFLSATLLSKGGFCSMTGLDPEEIDWFSADSPFPLPNREIFYFWRMGAPAINFQNKARELPALLDRIQQMLDLHPDEKGIIHTHTYQNAIDITGKLGSKYGRRFLFPKNAGEQKEFLEKHARSKNTVLVSPSMTEGVDLKGELCRFSGMCKVPYLPTNDPVVSARMEADSNWYAYRTAMTLVQAPGRGVRSMDDYCKTYFLDPGFQQFIARSRHLFPKWFLDSIVKGYKGHY